MQLWDGLPNKLLLNIRIFEINLTSFKDFRHGNPKKPKNKRKRYVSIENNGLCKQWQSELIIFGISLQIKNRTKPFDK